MSMTYSEMNALITRRAAQAQEKKRELDNMTPAKRRKAQDGVNKMLAAVDVACQILGEKVPDADKENRIKALFLDSFFS